MFAKGRTAVDGGWGKDGLPGDRFQYRNVVSRFVYVSWLFPACAAQLRAVIAGQPIEVEGQVDIKNLMDEVFGPGEELSRMSWLTGGTLCDVLVLAPYASEDGNLAARVRQADGAPEEIVAAEAIEAAYYGWRRQVVGRQPNLPDTCVAEQWGAERMRYHRAYMAASLSLAISDLAAYDEYVAEMTAALAAFVVAMDLPEFFFRER